MYTKGNAHYIEVFPDSKPNDEVEHEVDNTSGCEKYLDLPSVT